MDADGAGRCLFPSTGLMFSCVSSLTHQIGAGTRREVVGGFRNFVTQENVFGFV